MTPVDGAAGQELRVHESRPAPLRWLGAIELSSAAALLALIAALMITQAAQRHLPVETAFWLGELARYSFIALAFVVAGHLYGRGEQITIQIADAVLSQRWLRLIKRVAAAIMLAISIAFIYEALMLIDRGGRTLAAAIGIPMAFVYAVPLIGFISLALNAAYQIVRPTTVEPLSPEVAEEEGNKK